MLKARVAKEVDAMDATNRMHEMGRWYGACAD